MILTQAKTFLKVVFWQYLSWLFSELKYWQENNSLHMSYSQRVLLFNFFPILTFLKTFTPFYVEVESHNSLLSSALFYFFSFSLCGHYYLLRRWSNVKICFLLDAVWKCHFSDVHMKPGDGSKRQTIGKMGTMLLTSWPKIKMLNL